MKREEKEKIRFELLKSYDNELNDKGYRYICGIDEAGRGPLAGPVVAAAVVLPYDFYLLGIDDSKKISEKKRAILYNSIIENCLAYGVGIIDNNVIDEINILNATKKAMLIAIEKTEAMLGANIGAEIDIVLIDAVKLDSIEKESLSIIKGDQTSLSIAAASIIAKVTRDSIMLDYDKKYPEYGFKSNKGYGTKAHYEGIDSNGICEIHRKTFLKKYNY